MKNKKGLAKWIWVVLIIIFLALVFWLLYMFFGGDKGNNKVIDLGNLPGPPSNPSTTGFVSFPGPPEIPETISEKEDSEIASDSAGGVSAASEGIDVKPSPTVEKESPEKEINWILIAIIILGAIILGASILFFILRKRKGSKKTPAPILIQGNRKANQLLSRGRGELAKGNLGNAKKTYREIKTAYNPGDDKNKAVHKEILKFYNNLNTKK